MIRCTHGNPRLDEDDGDHLLVDRAGDDSTFVVHVQRRWRMAAAQSNTLGGGI